MGQLWLTHRRVSADVCSTLNSGGIADVPEPALWAKSGHQQDDAKGMTACRRVFALPLKSLPPQSIPPMTPRKEPPKKEATSIIRSVVAVGPSSGSCKK